MKGGAYFGKKEKIELNAVYEKEKGEARNCRPKLFLRGSDGFRHFRKGDYLIYELIKESRAVCLDVFGYSWKNNN